MSSLANELQAAIYSCLSAEPSLAGVPVVDGVAVDALPCIRIDEITEGAANLTFDRQHTNASVSLTAFVRGGRSGARALASSITDALLDWYPTLEGWVLVDLAFDSSHARRDEADPSLSAATVSFVALAERDEVSA